MGARVGSRRATNHDVTLAQRRLATCTWRWYRASGHERARERERESSLFFFLSFSLPFSIRLHREQPPDREFRLVTPTGIIA